QGQARADVEGVQRFFPAAAAALRLTHHPVPAALSCLSKARRGPMSKVYSVSSRLLRPRCA
ncbi:hypothetical protein, partial [Aquitalea pelogenes]|uniref:hypothetical protein n=1 Tax=Aquitalea pelogenes TaxID=1293573 RepID=UPI00137A057F